MRASGVVLEALRAAVPEAVAADVAALDATRESDHPTRPTGPTC